MNYQNALHRQITRTPAKHRNKTLSYKNQQINDKAGNVTLIRELCDTELSFRFICIVAWRLKIRENEKEQFTTNKAKSYKVK